MSLIIFSFCCCWCCSWNSIIRRVSSLTNKNVHIVEMILINIYFSAAVILRLRDEEEECQNTYRSSLYFNKIARFQHIFSAYLKINYLICNICSYLDVWARVFVNYSQVYYSFLKILSDKEIISASWADWFRQVHVQFRITCLDSFRTFDVNRTVRYVKSFLFCFEIL